MHAHSTLLGLLLTSSHTSAASSDALQISYIFRPTDIKFRLDFISKTQHLKY